MHLIDIVNLNQNNNQKFSSIKVLPNHPIHLFYTFLALKIQFNRIFYRSLDNWSSCSQAFCQKERNQSVNKASKQFYKTGSIEIE